MSHIEFILESCWPGIKLVLIPNWLKFRGLESSLSENKHRREDKKIVIVEFGDLNLEFFDIG